MRGYGEREALIWHDEPTTYRRLADLTDEWIARLDAETVAPGDTIAIEGDFSPAASALFLAAAQRRLIIVPIGPAAQDQRERMIEIAQVAVVVSLGRDDRASIELTGRRPAHALIRSLRASGSPGLVIFTSGSTGEPKAALHDLSHLLEPFRRERRAFRMISFLLLDHIGGVNTILSAIANGGCLVTVAARTPDAVAAAIARHRVELLPTTPTFLNLMLVGETLAQHDLSGLRVISYGTEPMPETTLRRIQRALPAVSLRQNYGLTELGILPARSRGDDPAWIEISGPGVETKIEGGTLRIRTPAAMLGYLNAPSPFDADGWMDTHDAVERSGGALQILGRTGDLINVGGLKVHPAEIEDVLLAAENVKDVTVIGERNAIMGQVAVARVNLVRPEDPASARARLRAYCRARLAPHKVPAKIEVLSDEQFNARFKRVRRPAS